MAKLWARNKYKLKNILAEDVQYAQPSFASYYTATCKTPLRILHILTNILLNSKFWNWKISRNESNPRLLVVASRMFNSINNASNSCEQSVQQRLMPSCREDSHSLTMYEMGPCHRGHYGPKEYFTYLEINNKTQQK